MFEYMTRHMVARKEFTYAGEPLRPGDAFVATPVDADYFVRCGRAAHASPQVVHAAPVVVEPVVVEPVVVENAVVVVEPVVETAPTVEPEAPVVVTSRRRGRQARSSATEDVAAAAGQTGETVASVEVAADVVQAADESAE